MFAFVKKVTSLPPIYNFILVVGLEALLMGIWILSHPQEFQTPYYQNLFDIMSHDWFGFWLISSGILSLYSYFHKKLLWGRIGLVLMGSYMLTEAASFVSVYQNGVVSLWPLVRDVGLAALCAVGAFSTFPSTNVPREK